MIRVERTPQVGVEWHPFADLFPWIEGPAYKELVEDIRKNGVLEPIVFIGRQILDGRNRYMAARELGIEYPRVEYEGDDPLSFVIAKNLARRHLTESQRGMVAAKLAKLPKGVNQHTAASANLPTQTQAADMLNVSERTLRTAKVVEEHGSPELVAAVETGVVSVSAAADVATLPKEEQVEIVARGEKEILEAAKAIRSERADRKREARVHLLTELSNRNAPLPDRRYPIIYADPPWQYDFSPSNDRSVENHYPTMPIEDICAMDVASLATPDAMLFLWAPPSFIKKGIAVLEAWGFELATSMVWVKDKIGTGIYVRQRHEYLLLGKRGQPITPRPGSQPDSVIEAPRQEHSAKPDQVYDLIERMYPGLPKIELFSRSPREGFDAWGNQAEAA
ncbi:MAG: MT-A70 family methyltransferase [Bradyrhizobium sp.]|uniref:MT-A70 family methyltransferase n=1 Tax=Bradyrhizobium sp. TaxID=376 RepID=UPI003D0B693C